MPNDLIRVEVVYANPAEQRLVKLECAPDTTVRAAIEQSGLLERYAEIDLGKNKIGIFGKFAKLDQTLRDRDRVEIYRPLIADPKEIRRQRAEQGKPMKKGG